MKKPSIQSLRKKPAIQALRGRVEEIAGAVEARVGHVLGNEKLEAIGRRMQTVGEARREAHSGKPGPEQEVIPTTEAPPVEVAAAEKKRAPKKKPDAPAKPENSVLQPPGPKPNRAQRRHPDPR